MPVGIYERRNSLSKHLQQMIDTADPKACIFWKNSKGTGGYGRVWFAGRLWSTSRLSYTLTYGPVQDDVFVLHKCDTPSCVNPHHLFLGTHDQNMADMAAKRRAASARNRHAVLAPDQVKEIRKIGSSAVTRADEYGVTRQAIRDILHRRRWKSIS
jgi:hypothetical protein